MTADQFVNFIQYGEGLILEPNSGVIGQFQIYIHWVSLQAFIAEAQAAGPGRLKG